VSAFTDARIAELEAEVAARDAVIAEARAAAERSLGKSVWRTLDAVIIALRRTPADSLAALLPRIISTIDELVALPPLSVIHTAGGTIACRHHAEIYTLFGDERGHYPWSALRLPATVLHEPTEGVEHA
jgi:hypothetical protein